MEQAEGKSPSIQEGMHAVWQHAKIFKRELIFLGGLGLISAVANGSVPYVSGKFFDSLIVIAQGESPMWNGVALWGALLALWAGVQLVANIVDWVMERRRRDVDTRLHFTIQVGGFQHLLRLPISYHKGAHINGVLQKLSMAGWRVSSIVQSALNVGPQFLSVCIGLLLSYSINALLASVLIAGVAAYCVLLAYMLRPVAKIDSEAHRVWNDEWDNAAQAVHQIESVKNAAAEDYESQKVHDGLFKTAYGLWMKLEHYWSDVGFYQRIIVFLTQLLVFVLSINLVSEHVITVGELVALNGYAAMMFGPFVQLGYSWQTIQNGLTAAVHAKAIFDEKQEDYTPSSAVMIPKIRGDIDFDRVTFGYAPGQPTVLSNVNFKVHAGDVVALVGESGVGKSTTISLISAYAFPTEGEVLIDGIATRNHDLKNLRSYISVVPQEVALFNDTIQNNIRYGTFSATDEEVMQVAREAHLEEFIEGLPKKYETVVGERGVKLSVGQKQRVAIARAMLRNPSILILDEPTSALDAKTEQIITASLERLMKGRTTFIIAHRLSTVRKANTILVFEKGTIVESGTHEELIRKSGGVYQRLYEYQIGLHE